MNINEIKIYQLCRDTLETTEMIKSTNFNIRSSYMAICNSLYNNMRNDEQISNLIIGLLLEFKEIVILIDGKDLILDNLSNRVENYKNLFTNLKDNNIINLIKPSKITHKESNKRKKSTYEQNTIFPVNKVINIKPKK